MDSFWNNYKDITNQVMILCVILVITEKGKIQSGGTTLIHRRVNTRVNK